MAMLKLKWFLPPLCLLLILGCSSDFKDPEKVIRSFYEAVFSSNKNFDKAYKYLSSESQRHADLTEFRKDFIETYPDVTRQITQLNILPEEKEHPAYRRVKITFDQTDNGNSTQNEIRYYTLIKEKNNWKIAWSEPTLPNLYKKRDEGLYNEAIKLAEEILSFNPYDASAYGEMAYCYYRLNNQEKTVANVRKLNALLPENNLINFLNNDIKDDSFGGCSDSEDSCLYSKISTYYKTWEIYFYLEDSKRDFEQAWTILKSIKPNIKESKYAGLAEAIGDGAIKVMVENHEFDKAWKTLKSIKQDITENKYKEIAKMIDEEKNKPITATIADLDDSEEKFKGKTFIVSGYLSYNYGNPELCERKGCDGGICVRVGWAGGEKSGLLEDDKEVWRQLKRLPACESAFVTIIGRIPQYPFSTGYDVGVDRIEFE